MKILIDPEKEKHIVTNNEYSDISNYLSQIDQTSDKNLLKWYTVAVALIDDLPKYMKRDNINDHGSTIETFKNLISGFICSSMMNIGKLRQSTKNNIISEIAKNRRNNVSNRNDPVFAVYSFEWLLHYEDYSKNPTKENEQKLFTTNNKMTKEQRIIQHIVSKTFDNCTKETINQLARRLVWTLNPMVPMTTPHGLKTYINSILEQMIFETFSQEQ